MMGRGGLILAVCVCLGGLILSNGQMHIPATPLGYTYMSPSRGQSPKVVVEIFFDHLCDGSKAQWVYLKEVFKDLIDEDVTAIIHIFPLPYHHNAFFAQQMGVAVQGEDMDKFMDYIQLMFDNQDKFLSGAVNMTEPAVQKTMATLTANSLDLDETKIMSGFADKVVEYKARYAWKYAASRGITGTPQYIVNGVNAPEVLDYDKEKWEQFINKLLNAPY